MTRRYRARIAKPKIIVNLTPAEENEAFDNDPLIRKLRGEYDEECKRIKEKRKQILAEIYQKYKEIEPLRLEWEKAQSSIDWLWRKRRGTKLKGSFRRKVTSRIGRRKTLVRKQLRARKIKEAKKLMARDALVAVALQPPPAPPPPPPPETEAVVLG